MNAKSIFLPFSNTFMPEFAVESARREASERSESFSITFAVLARRAGSGMSTASRSGDVTNLPKTETSGTQQTRKWTGWLRVDVGGIGLVCLPELLRMFVRRGHKTSQALVNMYVRSWNQLIFATRQLNCYLTRCWLLLLNRPTGSDPVSTPGE